MIMLSSKNKFNQIIVLCDCNGTRTHNHLLRKRILNHLAKLAQFSQTGPV